MKKITKIIFIITILIFSIIINGSTIKNYDVVMNINKESSLTITEKIEYEFTDLNRRSIFRDILLRKKDKENLKKKPYKNKFCNNEWAKSKIYVWRLWWRT